LSRLDFLPLSAEFALADAPRAGVELGGLTSAQEDGVAVGIEPKP
jgi:hypothetical protein